MEKERGLKITCQTCLCLSIRVPSSSLDFSDVFLRNVHSSSVLLSSLCTRENKKYYKKLKNVGANSYFLIKLIMQKEANEPTQKMTIILSKWKRNSGIISSF